jgi:hypothetical protein
MQLYHEGNGARGLQWRHARDKKLAHSDLRWRCSAGGRSGRRAIGDHAGVNVLMQEALGICIIHRTRPGTRAQCDRRAYQQELEEGWRRSRRGRVTSSERLLFIIRRNRMRTEAMGITRRRRGGEKAREYIDFRVTAFGPNERRMTPGGQ